MQTLVKTPFSEACTLTFEMPRQSEHTAVLMSLARQPECLKFRCRGKAMKLIGLRLN